jgi:hypothetical protein
MPTKITRSAKTGKFVSKKAAAKRPATTVTETVTLEVSYRKIVSNVWKQFAKQKGVNKFDQFTTVGILSVIKRLYFPGKNSKPKTK